MRRMYRGRVKTGESKSTTARQSTVCWLANRFFAQVCDALKPWVAKRQKLDRFVIRRDPRDISRIWVLDPEGANYIDVPYRRTSHPPVSVREQRAVVTTLREAGRAEVNVGALFRTIGKMRQVVTDAAASTKRARRDADRRTGSPTPARPNLAPPTLAGSNDSVVPYRAIQEW